MERYRQFDTFLITQSNETFYHFITNRLAIFSTLQFCANGKIVQKTVSIKEKRCEFRGEFMPF